MSTFVISCLKFESTFLPRLPTTSWRRFAAVSPRLNVSYRPTIPYVKPGDMDPEISEAEVLIGYHAYFTMDRAPKLRWLHLTGDGADHLRGYPIMQSDVIVTNTRVFATPITEYIMGSILSWFYHFPKMHSEFQEKRIYPKNQWLEYLGEEIEGKTLAIIGYGAIGQKLAQVAQAFGMNIIATRRSIQEPVRENGVQVYPADRLTRGNGAGRCGCCHPSAHRRDRRHHRRSGTARAETKRLSRQRRARQSDSGRRARARAAAKNGLPGAGLDVFAQRPLPPDSPFFDLDNVILTPHMSGVSNGYARRGVPFYCENLRRYLAGEPLLNLVDKQKGY